jgi:hypothetical protein
MRERERERERESPGQSLTKYVLNKSYYCYYEKQKQDHVSLIFLHRVEGICHSWCAFIQGLSADL